MELIPSVELVPNVNQITHRIELELELMPKNHQNPSPDSDPALELIQPYSGCSGRTSVLPGASTKRLTGKGGTQSISQAESVAANWAAVGQFLSISI